MASRTLAGFISLGIGVLSAARVALVWDRLPERMASHYGASGRPDGFMMRGDFFVFYFGMFGLLILMFSVLPRIVKVLPREIVNIPHREYWLTDERWPEAMDKMAHWMAWFGVAMAAFAAAVLFLVLRSNLQKAPLDNGFMFLALGSFLAFTGYWLSELYRTFRPPE